MGTLIQPDEIPLLASGVRQLTVYGRWEDQFGIDVNKVLQAVKGRYRSNDFVDGKCKKDRWRRTVTFWENRSTGVWGEFDCDWNSKRVIGWVMARFANSGFPACAGETLVVYYDRLWARVNLRKQDADPQLEGYYWGIGDTWAEGSRCAGLVRWIDIVSFPQEYWTFKELDDQEE